MSGHIKLSTSQQNILTEFRICAKDLLAEEEIVVDDVFLLRWLIAREFHLAKASVMLRNYLEWKNKNEIDRILEWSVPDGLMEACPFHIIPSDNDGRPVLVFPWGRWKPWIFTEKYLNSYQKYMDYMVNSVISVMNKSSSTQFVILGDSDGFTYGHMKYIKSIEVNLEAVKQFEAHYPELMHSAIVINCPKAFTVLFSLVKPLMTHRTRNKMNLFGCEKQKWKKFIAERIPQENLPNHYKMEWKKDGDTFQQEQNCVAADDFEWNSQ